MIQDNHVNKSDFPSLFNAADQSSLSAQGKYLFLIKSDLAILVASAIMSSWSSNGSDPLALPSAILATVGIFITIQLSSSKLDRVWFDARAVAESVKSLTWRYMTASKPFPLSLNNQNLDEKFLEEIQKVLRERKDIASELNTEVATAPQISEKMREIRGLDISGRQNLYLKYRVQDQLNWYSAKATYNRKARSKWFTIIIATQTLSLIAAILHAVFPDFPVNGTGVFAGLATAFLSWLQVKRHQDMSQSYALAAQELGSIESLGLYATSNESLSTFVVQAEEAISREHTLWVVKRSN